MTEADEKAILTLALMAAFADGQNGADERAAVTRVAQSLAGAGDVNVAALYQDVLLKRVSLEQAASALTSPEAKRLAYELAVGVCDADGAHGPEEQAFLSALQTALGFSADELASARAFTASADRVAAVPLSTVLPAEPAVAAGTVTAGDEDRLILNYAILNGALELLPDSLASMAIIPLQMKMVYRIGKSYGYELDRSHVTELLATAGVGMTSQYVEQVGLKLLGKVLGGKSLKKLGPLGGLVGGAVRQSVSSGFSFATTYALGRLAVRYYGGGRTFSAAVLKDTYAGLLGEAKTLETQYLPAIRERARTLDVKEILQDFRQPA